MAKKKKKKKKKKNEMKKWISKGFICEFFDLYVTIGIFNDQLSFQVTQLPAKQYNNPE